MDWVRQNWVFILFFIIFIAMHLFGGGCMPGHGRHRGHGEKEEKDKEQASRGSSEKKGGHGCH
ncbi:MAG: DUF2933 domain-containing protein [Nitrospirota bacterium]